MRGNLVEARRVANRTQVQLASAVGITTRQYQSLEAGTSNGSVRVWEALRDILNASSIDHLLAQEREPEDRPA